MGWCCTHACSTPQIMNTHAPMCTKVQRLQVHKIDSRWPTLPNTVTQAVLSPPPPHLSLSLSLHPQQSNLQRCQGLGLVLLVDIRHTKQGQRLNTATVSTQPINQSMHSSRSVVCTSAHWESTLPPDCTGPSPRPSPSTQLPSRPHRSPRGFAPAHHRTQTKPRHPLELCQKLTVRFSPPSPHGPAPQVPYQHLPCIRVVWCLCNHALKRLNGLRDTACGTQRSQRDEGMQVQALPTTTSTGTHTQKHPGPITHLLQTAPCRAQMHQGPP